MLAHLGNGATIVEAQHDLGVHADAALVATHQPDQVNLASLSKTG
jgi:hypothetical protein